MARARVVSNGIYRAAALTPISLKISSTVAMARSISSMVL